MTALVAAFAEGAALDDADGRIPALMENPVGMAFQR
jgi:hypothetical protein